MTEQNRLMQYSGGLSAANPISGYMAWVNRALGGRDNPEEFKLYNDDIDWGTPQLAEGGLSSSNRMTEVRAQPEPVWPPQSWWDAAGVMPSTQQRYGQAQAFAAKAADFWGIPSAILNRFAPEAAATVNNITTSHPTATTAGNVAGAVGSFAPVRAVGNALAARGHGRMAQAGADAGTVLALGGIADTIETGNPLGGSMSGAATQIAPIAVLQRGFMPNLPASVVARTAIGAGVGALPVALQTNTGDWQKGAMNMAAGGLLAAAGRPSARMPSSQTLRDAPGHAQHRSRVVESAILPAGIAGGAYAAGKVHNMLTPQPPLTTPAAAEWDMYRHQEPMEYPRPFAVFPEDVAYAEPSYPAYDRNRLASIFGALP